MPAVPCPECSRAVEVADHELGMVVECAGCGKWFQSSGQSNGTLPPLPAHPHDFLLQPPAADFAEPEPWFYRAIPPIVYTFLCLGLVIDIISATLLAVTIVLAPLILGIVLVLLWQLLAGGIALLLVDIGRSLRRKR